MNFSPLSPAHLTQQRQALKRAENAFKNQKQWLQERDEIEKNIFQLQQTIEQDFYKKYQRGKLDDTTSDEFLHTLEKKRYQILQLKKAQQQIDEQLDQTDNLSEEILNQQRFQLLHLIWQLYPEKRAEQEAKWQEWNYLRILEIEIFGIEKILDRLEEHLKVAIQTRQSIKGKGILNYIFGLSPNCIIEKQLMEMQRLIINIFALLEKAFQHHLASSLKLLLKNLATWLEQLKTTCGKSWSFRHLDALFAKTLPVLNQFFYDLRQQQQQLASRIQMLDQEILDWTQEE